MGYDTYETLTVRREAGVAFVVFDHPPLNLFDEALIADLDRFHTEVRADDTVRVIVFESANPEFYLGHGDMRLVVDPAVAQGFLAGPGPGLLARYRSLEQVTIAKIAGSVRGSGHEFLLTLDMRFAASGQAWFGQPEVSLGILPGGGGTQLLPRLLGRSRALEMILGSDLLDAATAQRYGLVNRALPAAELDGFVERLALRIASHPWPAVAAARKAVDAAAVLPLADGLTAEGELLWSLFTGPAAAERFTVALAAGAQTRAGELDLEGLIDERFGPTTAGGSQGVLTMTSST